MLKPAHATAHPTRFVREWWAEVAQLNPDPKAKFAAVRVGLAVSIPMVTLSLIGRPEWASYGVFGALTAVYGKHFGYRDRFVAGSGIGVLLLLAVCGGVLSGISDDRVWWSLLAMTLVSMLGCFVSRWRGWLPVPSLFLVFATGAIGSVPQTWADLPLAIGVAGTAAIVGIVLGQAGRLITRRHPPRTTAPVAVPVRALLGAPGMQTHLVLHGIGPAAAGAIAIVLGVGHPFWAAVSATVPLIGATVAAQVARGTLRLVGTALGIGVAVALLWFGPPLWVLLVAAGLLQVTTELFVARNYGLAVISITPLALIMTRFGAPIPIADLALDRIIETVIGIGVVTAIVATAGLVRRARSSMA